MKKYASARKLTFRLAGRLIQRELGCCPRLREIGSGAHFFEGVVGNFRIMVSQMDDDPTRIRMTVGSECGGGLIVHYYFADTLTTADAAIRQEVEESRWAGAFLQCTDPVSLEKRAESAARERKNAEKEMWIHERTAQLLRA